MRSRSQLADPPELRRSDLRLPSRRTMLASAVVVPLLSLLVLREPSYDPTAWLVWGRQIAQDGALDTVGGPSWKPLPVAFTTLFALAGSTVAPWLWLVVARAGAMLALLAAFALARRLSGSAVGGLLAAAALALASDFLFNAVRGDSEGLLVAAVLGAVLAHLEGRRDAALALGVAAALLRPEVWPLLAAYGLLLMYERRDVATAALLAALGAGVLAVWFVPEHIGSGDWLRAATRAQNPVPGSPGQSSAPFLMTFVNGAAMLSIPVYAGAVYAFARAWRERDPVGLTLAAAATVVMLIVAALAENGFTGNLRYVTLPAAILCVLAGVGLPPLAARLRASRLWRPALAVTAISVAIGVAVIAWGGIRLARDEQRFGHELPQAIERSGGARAIRACAPVSTTPFSRQAVAWRLRLRQRDVSTAVQRRGTVIANVDSGRARQPTVPVRVRHGWWTVGWSCRR